MQLIFSSGLRDAAGVLPPSGLFCLTPSLDSLAGPGLPSLARCTHIHSYLTFSLSEPTLICGFPPTVTAPLLHFSLLPHQKQTVSLLRSRQMWLFKGSEKRRSEVDHHTEDFHLQTPPTHTHLIHCQAPYLNPNPNLHPTLTSTQKLCINLQPAPNP